MPHPALPKSSINNLVINNRHAIGFGQGDMHDDRDEIIPPRPSRPRRYLLSDSKVKVETQWVFLHQVLICVYLIRILTVAFVPMTSARSMSSSSRILTGINCVTLVYVPEVVKLVCEPVSRVEVTVSTSWT